MSAQNDGGPAFPACTDFSRVNEGMTLRDWFAGQALAAIAGNERMEKEASEFNPDDSIETNLAEWAYTYADAMLAAREAKQ